MFNFKSLFDKKNIPNFLTFLRLIIAILAIICFFLGLIFTKSLYVIDFTNLTLKIQVKVFHFVGTCFFLIASVTDFLDGYLARKWSVISNFGKIFDPIVDKILVNGVLIALAVNQGVVIVWGAVLLIVRDICVDGLRMYFATKRQIVSANKIGKWKTTFQMMAILILGFLFNAPVSAYQVDNYWFYYLIQNGFIFVSIILAYWSLLVYFLLIFKQHKS